jgi:hypothetical protein
MTKAKTDASGAQIDDNAPDGLALSDSEAKTARHEGAKEAIKDAAKDSYTALTDGVLPGAPPSEHEYPGSGESQQYAGLIELDVARFEKVAASDEITDTMAAGLLKLERAGQNRTPYVKALMKRLGLKGEDLFKVTTAGPSYTNDVTNITSL